MISKKICFHRSTGQTAKQNELKLGKYCTGQSRITFKWLELDQKQPNYIAKQTKCNNQGTLIVQSPKNIQPE